MGWGNELLLVAEQEETGDPPIVGIVKDFPVQSGLLVTAKATELVRVLPVLSPCLVASGLLSGADICS